MNKKIQLLHEMFIIMKAVGKPFGFVFDLADEIKGRRITKSIGVFCWFLIEQNR